MKNTFSPFARLIALVACVVSLGSCSRSDYAMLPKGASYAGTARVATPVRATPAPVAPVDAAPAPVAAPAPAVSQSQSAASVAVAPTAQPATVATPQAAKPNLVQRLALKQLVRKVDKLTRQAGSARQHDNTAATQKLEGRLRQGIILAAIGLLVEILGAVLGSYLVYLLGAILIIVGGVFIVLYLIDKL